MERHEEDPLHCRRVEKSRFPRRVAGEHEKVGAWHVPPAQQNRYWWHISTMGISVKNNFERRLGIFPAAFDADGVLYTNTAYGDYGKNEYYFKGMDKNLPYYFQIESFKENGI